MREGIGGSFERSSARPYRWAGPRGKYCRLWLLRFDAILLHDAHFIRHRRRHVEAYEPIGDDRQQQNGRGEQHGKPEDGRRTHRVRRAYVVPAGGEYFGHVLAVQCKMKQKVNDQGSPYAKVVEAGPIGRVQTALIENILLQTLFLTEKHNLIRKLTCRLTTITRIVATANPKLCRSAASLPSAPTLWYIVPYGMKKSTRELMIPCITLNRNSFRLKRAPFWPGKYKLGYLTESSSSTSF